MKGKIVLRILIAMIIIASIIFFGVWNSDVNRNIRYLDTKLSDAGTRDSGTVGELFDFNYDTLYVFEAYQSKEEMEAQIGFKSRILQEVVSEGMQNVLFVQDNSPVAYVYGYPSNTGYNIELPTGKYSKSEMDPLIYRRTVCKVGNSSREATTYMNYTFDM